MPRPSDLTLTWIGARGRVKHSLTLGLRWPTPPPLARTSQTAGQGLVMQCHEGDQDEVCKGFPAGSLAGASLLALLTFCFLLIFFSL